MALAWALGKKAVTSDAIAAMAIESDGKDKPPISP